jgi:AraC family ethanolamine operon transcriptional activator
MTEGSTAFGEQRAERGGGALHFAETHDIDEQAALLRGWNQAYTQMSSGAFAGSITEVGLAGAQLFLEETNNALYQLGGLPRGLLAVGIPIRCSGLATFCGAPCQGTAVHVFSGRDGFEFHTPGGLIMAGIVLSDDMLASALSSDEQEAVLPSLGYAHLRRVADDKGQALRQLFADVFGMLHAQPHLTDNNALLETLRQAMVSSLAQALIDDRLANEPLIVPSRRWHIVASAREHIVDHPDTSFTVADLCRLLGVSRRSLQYCFQDVLGLGPAAFLRNVRLDGARRALKTGHSVTEAATLWSFWHFGRFAHDYKAMFGELPSETFRRYNGVKRTVGFRD